MSRRVTSLRRLYNFLAVVVLSAPDRFAREDYLKDEDQLNLDRAFEELFYGMQFVREKIKDETEVTRLRGVLQDSYAAYKAGDAKRGAWLLQDFEKAVFSSLH